MEKIWLKFQPPLKVSLGICHNMHDSTCALTQMARSRRDVLYSFMYLYVNVGSDENFLQMSKVTKDTDKKMKSTEVLKEQKHAAPSNQKLPSN